MRRNRNALLTLCLTLSLPALIAPVYTYTATDLGGLGGQSRYGEESQANGINASGQVTGYSYIPYAFPDIREYAHAFLYDGAMHDLGTLGGKESVGNGINAFGQVVGTATTVGDTTAHAFVWTPTEPNGTSGTMVDLGTLGGTWSEAWAINASGQVTGRSFTIGNAEEHAFLWTPLVPNGAAGVMIDLGTLGGTDSYGYGIDDSGRVTGAANTAADTAFHAFLYDGAMHDLGTFGGTHSAGWGMSGNGHVTGYAQTTEANHAFLHSGAMQDLGAGIGPQAFGTAVNASGQVTGYMGPKYQWWHPFLYEPGLGMIDLVSLIDPPLSFSSIPYGINDAGQIVANDWYHALLLTPAPEPDRMSMLGSGICLLLALHRYAHRRPAMTRARRRRDPPSAFPPYDETRRAGKRAQRAHPAIGGIRPTACGPRPGRRGARPPVFRDRRDGAADPSRGR